METARNSASHVAVWGFATMSYPFPMMERIMYSIRFPNDGLFLYSFSIEISPSISSIGDIAPSSCRGTVLGNKLYRTSKTFDDVILLSYQSFTLNKELAFGSLHCSMHCMCTDDSPLSETLVLRSF